MAKNWRALRKVAEECGELVVELMKLAAFPNGKHPSRKKSVVISTEEELADVLAVVDYFIDRNNLDRAKIMTRKAAKYRKFCGWWGDPSLGDKKSKTPAVKVKSGSP